MNWKRNKKYKLLFVLSSGRKLTNHKSIDRVTDNSSSISKKKKKRKENKSSNSPRNLVQFPPSLPPPSRSTTNRPRETSSFVIRKRVILTSPPNGSLATRHRNAVANFPTSIGHSSISSSGFHPIEKRDWHTTPLPPSLEIRKGDGVPDSPRVPEKTRKAASNRGAWKGERRRGGREGEGHAWARGRH